MARFEKRKFDTFCNREISKLLYERLLTQAEIVEEVKENAIFQYGEAISEIPLTEAQWAVLSRAFKNKTKAEIADLGFREELARRVRRAATKSDTIATGQIGFEAGNIDELFRAYDSMQKGAGFPSYTKKEFRVPVYANYKACDTIDARRVRKIWANDVRPALEEQGEVKKEKRGGVETGARYRPFDKKTQDKIKAAIEGHSNVQGASDYLLENDSIYIPPRSLSRWKARFKVSGDLPAKIEGKQTGPLKPWQIQARNKALRQLPKPAYLFSLYSIFSATQGGGPKSKQPVDLGFNLPPYKRISRGGKESAPRYKTPRTAKDKCEDQVLRSVIFAYERFSKDHPDLFRHVFRYGSLALDKIRGGQGKTMPPPVKPKQLSLLESSDEGEDLTDAIRVATEMPAAEIAFDARRAFRIQIDGYKALSTKFTLPITLDSAIWLRASFPPQLTLTELKRKHKAKDRTVWDPVFERYWEWYQNFEGTLKEFLKWSSKTKKKPTLSYHLEAGRERLFKEMEKSGGVNPKGLFARRGPSGLLSLTPIASLLTGNGHTPSLLSDHSGLSDLQVRGAAWHGRFATTPFRARGFSRSGLMQSSFRALNDAYLDPIGFIRNQNDDRFKEQKTATIPDFIYALTGDERFIEFLAKENSGSVSPMPIFPRSTKAKVYSDNGMPDEQIQASREAKERSISSLKIYAKVEAADDFNLGAYKTGSELSIAILDPEDPDTKEYGTPFKVYEKPPGSPSKLTVYDVNYPVHTDSFPRSVDQQAQMLSPRDGNYFSDYGGVFGSPSLRPIFGGINNRHGFIGVDISRFLKEQKKQFMKARGVGNDGESVFDIWPWERMKASKGKIGGQATRGTFFELPAENPCIGLHFHARDVPKLLSEMRDANVDAGQVASLLQEISNVLGSGVEVRSKAPKKNPSRRKSRKKHPKRKTTPGRLAARLLK